MKTVIFTSMALFIALSFAACGTTDTSQGSPDTDTIRVTGIVEVLYAGTRSETVIISDSSTGEVFALVGENAYEIIADYAREVSVLGRLTDEGYSAREDLRKLYVLDYAVVYVEDVNNY